MRFRMYFFIAAYFPPYVEIGVHRWIIPAKRGKIFLIVEILAANPESTDKISKPLSDENSASMKLFKNHSVHVKIVIQSSNHNSAKMSGISVGDQRPADFFNSVHTVYSYLTNPFFNVFNADFIDKSKRFS